MTGRDVRGAGSVGVAPLDATMRRVVEALAAKADESVRHGIHVMRTEAPEYFAKDSHDPDWVAVYTQNYYSHLRAVYSGLASGRHLGEEAVPALARDEAVFAAKLGVRLDSILHTYRIAHRLVLEELMDEATGIVDDIATLHTVTQVASRWLFAYFDTVYPIVTDAYQRQRDLMLRATERSQQQLVRDLLGGEPVDVRKLAYDIHATHVALIAWGAAPEQAIGSVRRHFRCPLLAVTGTGDASWGWLAYQGSQVTEAELRPLLPDQTQLAVGRPSKGISGFRQSHVQAVEAQKVAKLTDATVTAYNDVILLAMALNNEDLAREFVAYELGELGTGDDRNAVLRQTLRTYFDLGNNAASAAAKLSVSNGTIAYRIRTIEAHLGHGIAARRDEVSVALRLLELFGDDQRDAGESQRPR